MLQITVRYIDEDMRTPRGENHHFDREVDSDDFLDLTEDLREATRGFPFKHAPAITLEDGAGLLKIEAIDGQLFWSRPQEAGTGTVQTTGKQLAEIFFPKVEA